MSIPIQWLRITSINHVNTYTMRRISINHVNTYTMLSILIQEFGSDLILTWDPITVLLAAQVLKNLFHSFKRRDCPTELMRMNFFIVSPGFEFRGFTLGTFLLIYICNSHVLSHLLYWIIYVNSTGISIRCSYV
jgi:hypothetical protein